MYEISSAGSTYIMNLRRWVDLKTNLNKYNNVQSWYYALDPETKKDVERIIHPAPQKDPKKRKMKPPQCCFSI